MIVVGLTGNYGMGKSLVLEAFGKLGAETIDADGIVHELLRDEKVKAELVKLLGKGILDSRGVVVRSRVSDIIFKDESLRLQVEDLIHPLVFDRTDEIIANTDKNIVVVEAALIFERKYRHRFNYVITVYTGEDKAVARLSAGGIRRERAGRRIMSQLPIADKIKLSNFSIDNNGTKEKTLRQVEEIYAELLKLAGGGGTGTRPEGAPKA